MKTLLLFFAGFLFFAPYYCFAQNLVFNPSFEQYNGCPNAPDQLDAAAGWNSFSESPDYFNACATSLAFSVPYNWGGYQQAASGVAYSAFVGYLSPYYGDGSNYKELIGGTLLSSLTVGTKYFVSFKVSLSISDTLNANCAINNIGAGFSTVQYSESTPFPINNNVKVYENTLIKDTANWTKIFGFFVADSAYNYIIVGNLFDNAHTDTLILDSAISKYCAAYYYVDNVCVSTDSLYSLNYTWTGINEINAPSSNCVTVAPDPFTDEASINISCPVNSPLSLTIYNTLGQVVRKTENSRSDNIIIEKENLPIGMYFFNLSNETGIIKNGKFIIESK